MTTPHTSANRGESFATQFETLSGMTRWLVWLGVMTLMMALFGLAALGQNGDKAIEYGMYVVIGGLGIALIVKGYFDVRFLDRETRLASLQVRILESVDDFETFFKRAEKSVFRTHIDNLYTISLSQQEIQQDNLIQVLHDRLMARNRVVDLFASILVTLGLIGTIVGLILMMEGLTEVMRAQDAEEGLLNRLADSSTGPLQGLATAFYTTLLGAVLGGVMLRVLTNIVDTNVMRYTAHLAELTEVHVLPYMRRTARARLADDATLPRSALVSREQGFGR
jgi:hypothetical protein